MLRLLQTTELTVGCDQETIGWLETPQSDNPMATNVNGLKGQKKCSVIMYLNVNLVFARYFDEMYLVFPLVVLCERRLHDTSP